MSQYFKLSEWTCRDGTPYPENWVASRWNELAEMCDAIRKRWGSALVVSSGYRTKKYNTQIGGARNSQHPQGRAADLRPNDPARAPELHAMILQMYNDGELPKLRGLGYYPSFVHVDTRKSPKLVRWSGSRSEN